MSDLCSQCGLPRATKWENSHLICAANLTRGAEVACLKRALSKRDALIAELQGELSDWKPPFQDGDRVTFAHGKYMGEGGEVHEVEVEPPSYIVCIDDDAPEGLRGKFVTVDGDALTAEETSRV